MNALEALEGCYQVLFRIALPYHVCHDLDEGVLADLTAFAVDL
jgi:hypothetical protein